MRELSAIQYIGIAADFCTVHRRTGSLKFEELPLNRDLKEFRRLERACREHAAVASFDLEREGLLKVAEYYRKAIEALQRNPQRTADL
ncbi:hypothetical protein [Bradyrhizobium stylosanthis]|uniref:hypothetical protein n=1 Tax=Bradyrhizobium stylosanthis TaxID=1803665 RepID=UPI0007C5985D|nr:hypothetical protein [Bradyrhizobium stylosanthis]